MVNSNSINEGAELGDLKRLVEPTLSVDAYRSKMGEDKDICVVAFNVFSKEPANDLANFVEKSYDWVLDADVSSGETSDGNYLVFVEIQRDKKACDHIYKMLVDIQNLTEQEIEDWTFSYYKGEKTYPLTIEELVKHVISSPEEYELKVDTDVTEGYQLNSLRALAGVTVQPKKLTDSLLFNMQVMAGIK